MRAPQVAPFRAAPEVAVLDVGDRHLDRAGSEIQAEQWLGAGQPAPLDEVVGAELVRFRRVPGAVEYGWTLRLRPDAVEPVVSGDEIAAEIADDGDAEFLDFAHDVRAKSPWCPTGVSRARRCR